jgi:hypothetical protein
MKIEGTRVPHLTPSARLEVDLASQKMGEVGYFQLARGVFKVATLPGSRIEWRAIRST